MIEEQELDDPRVRTQRRIGAIGAIIALALAIAVGGAGGTGKAGMAVFLLVLAFTATIVAGYGLVTLLVDEVRSRSVSRARIGLSVGAFFTAAALMAMVAAVGG